MSHSSWSEARDHGMGWGQGGSKQPTHSAPIQPCCFLLFYFEYIFNKLFNKIFNKYIFNKIFKVYYKITFMLDDFAQL